MASRLSAPAPAPATAPAQAAASSAPVLAPLEKRDDRGTILYAACVLSAAAGAVNMWAFHELGVLLSHQTGNTCHITRQVEDELLMKLFAAALTFIVGSLAAGYAESDMETLLSTSRSIGMGVAGACVLVAVLIQYNNSESQVMISIILCAFSQGLQNGITSQCKALPVRTTHITGCFTDFGLIAGVGVKAKINGKAPPNPWKPALMILCIIFFGVGGLIEKVLLDTAGVLAGLAPAVVMLLSAVGALISPSIAVEKRRKAALLRAENKQYGSAA